MQRQDASCKDRRVLAKLTFATVKAMAMVGDDALDDGALEVRRIADRPRVRLHPPVHGARPGLRVGRCRPRGCARASTGRRPEIVKRDCTLDGVAWT